MANKVLDFLFGKKPDIFDEQGRVSHKLPKKTWSEWHNRTKMEPGYNWRNHSGVLGTKNTTKQKSN